MADDARDVAFHKKRRITKASMTKLSTKVTELEVNAACPTILETAHNLADKLKGLHREFRAHQLAILDQTDDGEELEEEQQVLDNQEDVVSEISIRIQRIINTATPSSAPDIVTVATKQITLLRRKVDTIATAAEALTDREEDTICTLEEYRDQLVELKTRSSELGDSLLCSTATPDDRIVQEQTQVDKELFDCLVSIKRHLRSETTSTSEVTVTKLPKLELPTLNGDILKWKNFWEQFSVSVHDKPKIPKEEKLMYLQNAIKDKTAKNLIAGLTKSSEHYDEAVQCLQERYDRPRQIHQMHVRRMVEAPSLKDGTGKEIRALHDLVVQHLRALKSLGHEPSKPFITSLLEMKLDPTTTFEWQRHSQESTDAPDYQVLLDFLNLHAQASEAAPEKKRMKIVSTLVAQTSTHSDSCIACGQEKHQLYACSKFRLLSHAEKIDLLKSNNRCLNCLRPGQFVRKCKSLNHCKHCQKTHHSLLHLDEANPSSASSNSSDPTVPTHHVMVDTNILLMTCQVIVETPHGTVKARALLDTGSSASFVTERLAQSLHLCRYMQNARICGTAGLTHSDGKQPVTQFSISSICYPGRSHNVHAFIVPKITGDLPVHQLAHNQNWDHLNGLKLADPDYNKSGKIDILLGVATFVDIIPHGRRCGPPNTPTALNTDLGWVLAGSTGGQSKSGTTVVNTNLISIITGDDLLRRFWDVEEKAVLNYSLTTEERSALDHFNSHHTRDEEGRFIVPLPKRSMTTKLGESRSQAVR